MARLNKGWTRKELAEVSNIGYFAIRAIENGKVTNPHVQTVEALAAALDLSMSKLFEENIN